MGYIELNNTGKSYGSREVLRDINLSVEEGEFVAVVGTSASGKTTLVNIASGLIPASTGTVYVGGKPVHDFPDRAAIVFQNYSLLPWLCALENVQLAVESAFPQWGKPKHREQAVRYLEMVGLGAALSRRPGQLSGGMRQRVAIARAFAVEPAILFLDEPFGALDALTRATLQQELARLCEAQQPRATVLMITNSVDEAILLSDRVVTLGRTAGRSGAASLGPAMPVTIPKPRPADLMMHNDEAVRLRGQVTDSLIGGRVPAAGRVPAQPSLRSIPVGA